MGSPRDRFLTVYGRQPVLEVLRDPTLTVDKVLVADGASVDDIVSAARARGVDVRRVSARDVTRLSRNGRQDQGVAADVVAPRLGPLAEWPPPETATVLLVDGITTPGNLGLLIRSATAAGLDAVVLPTKGVADLGPQVVKASAGVAFKAPLLRTPDAGTAATLLRERGFRLYGLDAAGPRSLFDPRPFADRAAFVVGSESAGITVDVDERVHIPMASDVESLNAAVAGSILCFELVRRRLT